MSGPHPSPRAPSRLATIALALLALFFFAETVRAGTTIFRITQGGSQGRKAVIHVPDRIEEQHLQAPVVFALHGRNGAGTVLEYRSQLLPLAEREGFIVVFPDGSPRPGDDDLYWDVPPFEVSAKRPPITGDVDFLNIILRRLKQRDLVEHGRVYVIGFDNGGSMAYRLGCTMSGTFSGIVSVGGPMTLPECRPDHPLSVLHIHGWRDNIVPWRGGVGQDGHLWPDQKQVFLQLSESLSCQGTDRVQPVPGTTCQAASCTRDARIEFCLDFSTGHTWPGQKGPRIPKALDRAPRIEAMDATAAAWSFLSSLPDPVAPIGP